MIFARVQQSIDRTQGQRGVVGPGARRLIVGTVAAKICDRVPIAVLPRAKLDRDSKRVAYSNTPQAAKNPALARTPACIRSLPLKRLPVRCLSRRRSGLGCPLPR